MLKEFQSLEASALSLEEDIMSFEDNISQIRLLLLFIDNERLINSIETKINIKNNQMSRSELINHIQNINELKDYKIQYLLNFTIEKSPQELCNNTNIKTFQFEQHKYSENVYFTAMNSLIIIANKNNKYYIKRKNNLEKKNTSKKNIKS